MKEIPWILILLIGGLLSLELLFNFLIRKDEKYRRVKTIVFISFASLIFILSLVAGDKQQIQNSVLFLLICLALVFKKNKSRLGG